MISRFFIDRPIFASVLSIVITLTGGLVIPSMPIAEYPEITPPSIQVSISYPGANARIVADTVAAPIEQQVNGVPGMLYMSSQSANDGSYTLSVTFELSADLNTAMVMVQNRVALAIPQLPNSVQRQGITIRKKTPDILQVVNLYSPAGRFDSLFLSNYATIYLKDELLRLEGVSDVNYLGERDYSIRAWLDPQQLASRSLSATEVVAAIKEQNQSAAPGQLGHPPAGRGQPFQLPLDTLGRLTTPTQFGDIVVKVGPGPAPGLVRLRDLGRIELGAKSENDFATFDTHPCVALGIHQLPGSNALAVGDRVRQKMKELSTRFPDGLEYFIAYDTTPYTRDSVKEVVWTLLQAIAIVALVVLLFLQSWRAALIPLVAVPVAIIGTFAVMAALGFSINNISLFGLVLAIGIVVDDAIVVIENVQRWLEQGLPPRDAACRAMEEVTGPVIAMALVLCAVFVPCAFLGGITGQFFRQFAVTITASTVLSLVNSLTLSPALAALLLRPRYAVSDASAQRPPLLRSVAKQPFALLFRVFNATFSAGTTLYTRLVGGLLRVRVLTLLVYCGLLVLTGYIFARAPTGFVPRQDMGLLVVNVQLPDSASVQRSQEVMALVERIALDTPGVQHTITDAGMSLMLQANSSNYGTMLISLAPFAERRSPELNAFAIMARLRRVYADQVKDALVSVFGQPPIPGLALAGGFQLMVEDRAGLGLTTLQRETDKLVGSLRGEPGLLGVFTPFRANTPQLFMDIDRTKVESLGVSLEDLDQTLQVYLGSAYVNNFNEFGRYWQVNLQAEGKFRTRVSNINLLQVRNRRGEMVPLGTLVKVRPAEGPVVITRYNLYSAGLINGDLWPDLSSGEAIDAIAAKAAETLPRSMSSEWTGIMFMELRAGHKALYVFALAVVFVFLALAALYESWKLPLAVILVVPLCLLCSSVGVLLSHRALDIFVQIGFVVLVGLASKNAILIVEFARTQSEAGVPRREAILDACRLRLRPILMTSLAFIFGVVPLMLAEGAGSEMRRSLGIAVFSGMLGVTAIGIFLTPVFFSVIDGVGGTEASPAKARTRIQVVLRVLLNLPLLGIPALLFYLLGPALRRPRPAVEHGKKDFGLS